MEKNYYEIIIIFNILKFNINKIAIYEIKLKKYLFILN